MGINAGRRYLSGTKHNPRFKKNCIPIEAFEQFSRIMKIQKALRSLFNKNQKKIIMIGLEKKILGFAFFYHFEFIE